MRKTSARTRQHFSIRILFLLFALGTWLAISNVSESNLNAGINSFVSECLFSIQAATKSRITATMRVVRLEDPTVPLAFEDCETSSGTMRLVLVERVKNMCWYANDYSRLLSRLHRSSSKMNFLLCDRDCVDANITVLSVAKSRKISHISDRTVTVLPVNVGRHFKWMRYALRDPTHYDRKIPVALWRGVTTSECWLNEEQFHARNLENSNTACARKNLVYQWSTHNSTRVDVGIVRIVQLQQSLHGNLSFAMKNEMTVSEMLKYRYLISVEGNDVATNLKWALVSNSVVLMP